MLNNAKNMGQSLKEKIPKGAKSGRRGEPGGEYMVALDVGTEFVKALIGRVTGDEVEIIGVGRAHQELADMQAGAISDIAAVVANCDKALAAAEQQAGVSARTAMVGIAGELVKGTTSTVRFTRKNSSKEISIDEMRKSLKLALSHDGEAKHKAEIEKALTKTLNVWTNGVDLALSEFTKLDHLPHRILLCGGGSSLQMLMHRLETAEWHKTLPFTRKPIIQHIKPEEVVGITDSTGSIGDHTYITAMGLLRVGMDTLNSAVAEGTESSLKGKLNRLLRT
jgi:hypothetical protein